MSHEENLPNFSAPPLILMVLPFVLLKLLLTFEPQITTLFSWFERFLIAAF